MRPFPKLIVLSCSIFLLVPSVFAASVQVSWDAPTTNVDGSELTDLDGYVVAWGSSRRNLRRSRDIGVIDTHRIDKLRRRRRYFVAVAAYDISGNVSEMSEIARVPRRLLRRRRRR